jgi:hypothetical protein
MEASSDVALLLPGGHTINAHKAILSTRCEKFRNMFVSPPKESSDPHSVEIMCDDAVAFTAMIEYLYTSEVNFQQLSVGNVVNLGYLASEFLLHELAFFCRNSLVLSLGAASVCKVFSYAFECDDILRLCCLDFIYQHFNEVQASGELEHLDLHKSLDIMTFLHSKAVLSHLKHKVSVPRFTERKDNLSFRSDAFAFHGCLWQFSFDPSESTVDVNLFLHNYAYLGAQLHFSLEFVNFTGDNIKIVATHDFDKVGSVYGFVIALQKRSLRLKEDSLDVVVEITPPKKKIENIDSK